jgi:transposase InsO family protein
MCLGSLEQLQTPLRKLGLTGTLQTAFIERLNRTLRRSIAGLARRTWAMPRSGLELAEQFEWWRAWYHFCQPHASLRVQLETPRARRGRQTPQCYLTRPPAMAVGLTDHVWTVAELLAFPC